MSARDNRLADVNFTSEELIKLFAATFLPLCELLEAQGVVTREKVADAMSLYVQPDEASSSATMVAALQIVLRRPVSPQPLAHKRGIGPRIRVIDGGLSER